MTDTSDTTPDTGNLLSDWQAKHAAQTRLRDELLPGNKATLFSTLAAAGITHVLVDFDGCSDEGQFGEIIFKNGDATVPAPEQQIEIALTTWGQPEPERSTVRLAIALENLAYDFLEQTHDGWEINDGAYGQFTFDVAAQSITLDYNERITDSEYSQHIF